ncbi:MAG: hypothetical protein ACO1RX_10510 [Candidatus Sericytochromatia bacterium]
MQIITLNEHDSPQETFEALVDTIAAARQNIGENFLTLGQALATIKQNKLYELGQFANFGAFLRDRRVAIASQDAERFIAISQDPAFERQLSLGLSKMLELMKLPTPQREQLMTQGAELGGVRKDLQEMNLSEIKQATREIKREGKTPCDRCRRWVDNVKELDGHFYGDGGGHTCFELELEERRSLSSGRMPQDQVQQVLETLRNGPGVTVLPEAPPVQWLPDRLYQLYGQLLQDQAGGEVSREGLLHEQDTLRKLVHLCQNRLHEIQELLKALDAMED